jgi:hypothetical protein
MARRTRDIPELLDRLHSGKRRTAKRAADALLRLPPEETVPALLQLMLQPVSRTVFRRAGSILLQISSDMAAEALIELFVSTQRYNRAAAELLHETNHPRALATLHEAMLWRHHRKRCAALTVLADHCSVEAIEPLCREVLHLLPNADRCLASLHGYGSADRIGELVLEHSGFTASDRLRVLEAMRVIRTFYGFGRPFQAAGWLRRTAKSGPRALRQSAAEALQALQMRETLLRPSAEPEPETLLRPAAVGSFSTGAELLRPADLPAPSTHPGSAH